jgi:hypothetical protein
MIRDLNRYSQANPDMLADDERSIAADIGIDEHDEFMRAQLHDWFDGFARNLREPPADARFPSDASPTGAPMTSLRDVEEQAPLKGNSTL